MPIKKKTTAAKKPAAKKPAVLGPKAKLMKLLVGTLRNKAKKLGISDVAKRTKENLAQSIMLAEARKKKGTTLGKKATAKKRTMAAKDENRQTGSSDFTRDYDRLALLPGRRTTETGSVYYERRKNRSDADRSFTGLQGENNKLIKFGYRECGILGEMLVAWSDQKLSSLAKKYFGPLTDFGFNRNSGNVYLVDEDYNVVMFNDSIKKLDLFLSTPYEGQEGFIEDLLIDYKTLNEEDQDFVMNYYKELSEAEKRAYKKPVR